MRNFVNSVEDFKELINHPYRVGEYFSDGTQVFEVPAELNEVEALIETYEVNELEYHVNWEDSDLYTESGVKIESVY